MVLREVLALLAAGLMIGMGAALAVTLELIFGLPTLSLFDMIANNMRASFQDAPALDTYEHVRPRQSLFEVNPPVHGLRGQARKNALASMKMRWNIPLPHPPSN
jgi:hypothetical protein